MWAHGSSRVALADLPAFGRPVRLVWAKRRWRCPEEGCSVCTFTDQGPPPLRCPGPG
ncbi:transposase family protein [Candidatus Poriferisodalis sp.]|uniref:transposase family protein n=1 Tax=Candidatus Poriferisodalis sp. TaxID=3101277 RepID=UPI003B01B5D0